MPSVQKPHNGNLNARHRLSEIKYTCLNGIITGSIRRFGPERGTLCFAAAACRAAVGRFYAYFYHGSGAMTKVIIISTIDDITIDVVF
jgi:hypothetical protein